MQLLNTSNKTVLAQEVSLAESFKDRCFGLMWKKSITPDWALHFKRCNWIHTFFVKVPIDVIYVDKNLIVKKIQINLQPSRFPLPVIAASAVFEMRGGSLSAQNIKIGDQLYVGH